MPLTKDELLAKLDGAGIKYTVYEHEAVMTVEAQVSALPGNPSTVLKNLFIKDKKHRCYIITALPDTKIDLQVLSARLGTGKGGIRMAPEDLLQAVLQVPLGSVTPLAVANPEAADVVLLLDAKVRDLSPADTPVYVHPLVNTVSLAMAPEQLAAALRAVGREPLWVDLEADPKIDRDNPPDLKAISDAAKPPAAALPPADGQAQPAAAAGGAAPAAKAAAAAPAAAAAKDASKKAAKGGKAPDQGSKAKAGATTTASLTDVAPRVEELLRLACSALLGVQGPEEAAAAGRLDAYGLARLRADVAMQLTGLKNASYAAGYTAGKGEVVAHAERRYA